MSAIHELTDTERWVHAWLDGVVDGSTSMSQRKLTSVEKRGGGVEAVRRVATAKGVHLLVLEDDQGDQLVAASTRPFTVVC